MFKELVLRWLKYVEHLVELARGTKAAYARIVAHLAAWAAERPVEDLDLNEYVLERREAGIAPRTIALELRVARMIFRWGQEMRLVPSSENLRCPRMRIDPQRYVANHVTPTPSEAASALAAMPDDDWKLAVLIIARTGARVGEVVALRSCDFDEARGYLAFGATEGASKTGFRSFPLDPDSVIDLAGRGGRGEEPLFDFAGRGDPREALRHRLMRACERAAVPVFTPHGLRRMVVGRLLRAKIDAGTAATLTGHSVNIMLRYYQIVSDDDRRYAAEQANLGVLIDPPRRTSG